MAAETAPLFDESPDDFPTNHWWDIMGNAVSEHEQQKPLKIATACSGVESPILGLKADVVCASAKVPGGDVAMSQGSSIIRDYVRSD